MPSTTIIIPTYGKRIETTNSLAALLDSIVKLKERDFRVVILNNTIDPEHHKKIEIDINKIISRYKKHFGITQVTYKDISKIHDYLDSSGFPDITDNIHVKGYSNFRNLGLLVARLLDSQIAIFLDDDEIIEDSNYLKKAREFVGKKHRNKLVGGITGYYINPNKTYLMSKHHPITKWWALFWNTPKYMNMEFSAISQKKRLIETALALGGNLVLHEKLFTAVPFDPYITRGEDIDLSLNAKIFGYSFLLDTELSVAHYPETKSRGQEWAEIRKNAFRFIYKRYKLLHLSKDARLKGIIQRSVGNYPGKFLRFSITPRVAATSLLLAIHYMILFRFRASIESLKNIKITFFDTHDYAKKNFDKYIQLKQRWGEVMEAIPKDGGLVKHFNSKFK